MSFDTTPKPFFLQAMRNQSWNVTGALAELVDNSFGPGRGNAETCAITYDTTKKMLTIVDDGVGMPSIGRLFQLGNTVGRSPGDIGLYGSGGTMAILWLASAVSVYTLRGGKVSSDTVVWSESIASDRFPRIDESWQPASLANCPTDLLASGHGTAISIKLAPERGALNISNIKRDLAKIYGPGIRAGKQIVWTTVGKNGETEVLADPIVMPADDDKIISFEVHVTHGDDVLPVTGQVALIESLKLNDSGIYIGYGSRVITKTKDCFVSPDGTERFNGSSVIGWLDLGDGWQPYLSTTKDAVNDKPVWAALMGFVFEQIKPLLEESDDEKLSLELEDIALSLQNLFDGASTVTVQRKPIEVPEIPPGPDGVDPIKPPKTIDVPEDEAGSEEIDKPAKAEILIIQQSDEKLDGVLCQAEKDGLGVLVYVNRDHAIIQTAILQKPTNRMLLNQIVVNEIANIMATDAGLCALAFKPRVAAELTALEDAPERARKLIRIMADSIKSKPAA